MGSSWFDGAVLSGSAENVKPAVAAFMRARA
jgi:hypothetical protein